MAEQKNRKIKLGYFALMLVSLAFLVPVSNIALLPAYLAFTSSVAGICALIMGTNVAQKVMTKDVYMKQLEMVERQDDPGGEV